MIQKVLILIILCIVTDSIAENNSIDELLKTRRKIESLYGINDIQIVKNKLDNILLTVKSDSVFSAHFNLILDTCNTSEKIILETIKTFDRQCHQTLLENFLKSENKKVLFFGTSVSCHCTLEMCDEFLKELISNSQKNGLHYLYVDAFYNNKLMKKYDALFIPTAVFLDENNTVIALSGEIDSLKIEITNIISKNRN